MKKFLIVTFSLLLLGALIYFLIPSSDYYEYEAASKEECLSGEEYDEDLGVCYFDFYCETEQECVDVDQRYGDVLESLALEYQQADLDHHQTRSKKVDVENKYNKEIVLILEKLIPSEELLYIDNVIADSDGPDGSLAYVETSNETGSKWTLAYDPVDSFSRSGKLKNKEELLTTLIHEYAHILALNDNQVRHVWEEEILCQSDEVVIDEGCAKRDSYITKFINKFWSLEERERANESFINGNEEDYAYNLYYSNQEDFVTEYAATNAIEDFAESFALFVMQSLDEEVKTIASEKMLFFYQYPELISMRKNMRRATLEILERKNQ